jgi:5,10-methylene-tetrahydrofolate dehydrogenase/methenyl tetrahydrofolate cyclohydrolase
MYVFVPTDCVLKCCAGVRAEVAAVEKSSVDIARNVEAPVVVVTGASRGIGKAIALTLGKAGCKVSHLSRSLTIAAANSGFAHKQMVFSN